jgi:small subunit ribosomal protein S20
LFVPRTASAKKALRKSRAANERNRPRRTQLRSAVRKVRAAATKDEAQKALAEAIRLLDRAGRKNLIHKNTADRAKSRLTKAVATRQ